MDAQGRGLRHRGEPAAGPDARLLRPVLISKAAGIEYRTLIGEILAGGLKRLREKRREASSRAPRRGAGGRQRRRAVNGNGGAGSNGNGGASASTPTPQSTGAAAAASADRRAAMLPVCELGFASSASLGRFPTGPLQRHHRRRRRARRPHHAHPGRGPARGRARARCAPASPRSCRTTDIFVERRAWRRLRAQRRRRGLRADPGRRVGPARDADPAHQHACRSARSPTPPSSG